MEEDVQPVNTLISCGKCQLRHSQQSKIVSIFHEFE